MPLLLLFLTLISSTTFAEQNNQDYIEKVMELREEFSKSEAYKTTKITDNRGGPH